MRLHALILLLLPALTLDAQTITTLKGAGATFPEPIYQKWFANYRARTPGVELTYEAIGSEAGTRKLLKGEIDFGASDDPKILEEVAPAEERKYLFVPSVMGAVVPIVNLPGFPGDLAFTPEALADIYLGKIKKWNDPLLRKLNPKLTLPNLDIVVVHRTDGSGTSYVWSNFLTNTNAQWREQVGASSDPKWPCGRGANGNSGVAQLVKELGGSIGYVEFIYALENHLNFGKVMNAKGRFVLADLDGVQNADGAKAYPIVSLTWFVVPAHIEDEAKRRAIKDFLQWMLGSGQRQAAALGYGALPAEMVQAADAALAKIN